MRAAVITGPGTIEVTTLPDPAPTPDGVVIAVAAAGVCGTDLHILAGEHGRLPVVPGHEVTGTVVAVGADVRHLDPGDRVAVDPSLPCGRCRWCRAGRSNLCPDLDALGVTVAGGAAEFMAAPARSCVVLPEHVDLREATLIEPLSCVVHAADVIGSRLGASVLVYGAGTIGLLMLALAARGGASGVDVVELVPERLDVAKRLGADAVSTSAATLARPDGWDLVIDATGHAGAIADGLTRVARGGTFLQLGVAAPDVTVPISPYDVYHRELTIVGSMAVLHSFERAAQLYAGGLVDGSALVTGRYPLSESAAAFEACARGDGIKTQLIPSMEPSR